MLFDYHVHTDFSGDCSIPMESVIQAGVNKGLKEICFTDHLDIDSTDGSGDFVFSHEDYSEVINRFRDKYNGQIEIKMGVEIGLQPHVLNSSREFVRGNDFDFALASMHCCERLDFYLGDFFNQYTTEEAICHYYNELDSMLDKFKDYSVLGHLDIYKRYNPASMKIPFKKYNKLVERVLKKVIKEEKGIEINTSGLRGPIMESLPGWEIVELYRALGGEILTLGSDSHGGETLCANFEEVLRGLKVRGFNNIYRFEKMQPKEILINSLL